ncbi:MAG: translational GTPase TypA [Deltaproteobacteria bacterium]|nr:translational GTPase TypA [Deltaproteobacteria bacterium]
MATGPRADVRNVAIIAHVDHGKTTLVDGLLKQAGSFRVGEVVRECALDSNPLERERGITILSKATAITWKGIRINIVDTPGHADFGGEVERVLRMVDSVLLLVDAFEGPLPQTRFVTKKAFALGLRPILVVNKIDREGCDPDGTVNEVFDLFCSLGATDQQLDFPVIYASGREGYAIHRLSDLPKGLAPLLDLIVERVPPPLVDRDAPLCLQAATLDYDDYLGYVAIGRVTAGHVRQGDRVVCVGPELLGPSGEVVHAARREEFRVQKLLAAQGLKRFEIAEGAAGDIIMVSGMGELNVGDTITDPGQPTVLPPLVVDEPTISMQLMVNTGPFAGTEGRFVTSRNLRERLQKEIKSNVALRVEETDAPDEFKVSGRGELHLSVLIETMRREGYELCVSQPQVIFRERDGKKLEPYEEVLIDVDEAYTGPVIENLGGRGGRLLDIAPGDQGRVRMEYAVPSRGLIGFRQEFLTSTRGTGVLNHSFKEYGPFAGAMRSRTTGVLVVQETGETNTYGLFYLQERGPLFFGPGVKVYGGQIVGEHMRPNDLIVNPSKAKKLTNIRTTAADEKLFLTPPKELTLEEALEFINEDELVEVTPKAIRLRKRVLDHNVRKRAEKESGTGLYAPR